jgi:thioredoxin 1
MQELTSENFAKETKTGMAVVDFWAAWCGPCKMMAPIFEAESKEHKNIKFMKLDVDAHPEIASKLGIMSIPTLLFYKDGEVVEQLVGYAGKHALAEKIKEAFS